MRNGQKEAIKQAQTMLRMILPKKTSFEYLTQQDLRTIVAHMNPPKNKVLAGGHHMMQFLKTMVWTF